LNQEGVEGFGPGDGKFDPSSAPKEEALFRNPESLLAMKKLHNAPQNLK